MWRDAIRVAVMRAHKDPKKGKKLQALAEELVEAGLERDVTALKEIGDRLDGKATQPNTHTGADGGPVVVTWLPPQ